MSLEYVVNKYRAEVVIGFTDYTWTTSTVEVEGKLLLSEEASKMAEDKVTEEYKNLTAKKADWPKLKRVTFVKTLWVK